MSFESRLMEAAKAATGDDSIIDVAEFHPKGTAAATAAGAALGSVAGDASGADQWGQTLATTAGAAGGAAVKALSSDLPAQVAVAISDDEVYVLGMPAMGVSHLDPIAKIDRDKLGVEVHQRVSVRTVVLEDLETGHRYALEAQRLNFYHAKSLIRLLMLNDEHHDDERDEADADSTEPVSS